MPKHAFVLSALLLAIFFLHPSPIKACAAAYSDGTSVSVAEESAVVVWDAPSHTEHFIRRAEFQTQASDFGFLVPTPTLPKLAQASDRSFVQMERLMEPKVNTEVLTGGVFTSMLLSSHGTQGSEPMAGAKVADTIEVFSAQKIGQYDAVVLKANNAAALSQWLKKHGYSARPSLAVWLEPYVARHWYITAFKIVQSERGNLYTSSSAIRLSFQAEKPFFPYSEPADQRSEGHYYGERLLRVFLLDTHRMAGTLGQGANSKPWPGKVTWASPIPNLDRNTLARHLAFSANQLPDNLWMTAFEDASSPRVGTNDLYFSQSPLQSPLLTSPVTEVQDRRIPIPIEPVVFVVIILAYIVVRHKSRRENSAQTKREAA